MLKYMLKYETLEINRKRRNCYLKWAPPSAHERTSLERCRGHVPGIENNVSIHRLKDWILPQQDPRLLPFPQRSSRLPKFIVSFPSSFFLIFFLSSPFFPLLPFPLPFFPFRWAPLHTPMHSGQLEDGYKGRGCIHFVSWLEWTNTELLYPQGRPQFVCKGDNIDSPDTLLDTI